jgi:hypothetical protein
MVAVVLQFLIMAGDRGSVGTFLKSFPTKTTSSTGPIGGSLDMCHSSNQTSITSNTELEYPGCLGSELDFINVWIELGNMSGVSTSGSVLDVDLVGNKLRTYPLVLWLLERWQEAGLKFR